MKNFLQKIQNKIDKIKEDNNNYNNLIANSQTIQNLTPIPELNNDIIDYKVNLITTTSPALAVNNPTKSNFKKVGSIDGIKE